MALVSAAEVRAILDGGALSGTGEDTLLGTLIDRADGVFARYLGFPPSTTLIDPSIGSLAYTLFSGDGPHDLWVRGDRLVFPVAPITVITTIHDDPLRAYGAGTLVSSAAYGQIGAREVWASTSGGHVWTTAPRSVKAVVTAGFSTTPDDLKHAACLYVAHLWHLRSRQGLTNVSSESGSVSYGAETIPKVVRQMLEPYCTAGAYCG